MKKKFVVTYASCINNELYMETIGVYPSKEKAWDAIKEEIAACENGGDEVNNINNWDLKNFYNYAMYEDETWAMQYLITEV